MMFKGWLINRYEIVGIIIQIESLESITQNPHKIHISPISGRYIP